MPLGQDRNEAVARFGCLFIMLRFCGADRFQLSAPRVFGFDAGIHGCVAMNDEIFHPPPFPSLGIFAGNIPVLTLPLVWLNWVSTARKVIYQPVPCSNATRERTGKRTMCLFTPKCRIVEEHFNSQSFG